MKFLLVKALADDHGYTHFVNSLDRALRDLGHQSVVSDVSGHAEGGSVAAFQVAHEAQASGCEAVLSFSSFFGSAELENGQALFDALGVKFVGWQLDHPVYAPQCLARALKNRFTIYSNHNHLRFAQALGIPGRGATMLLGAEPPSEPLRKHRARIWPVFVAATWNGVPERWWETLPDTPARRLLVGVIERLLADSEASLLDAFIGTAAQLELQARLGADSAFDDQMIAFLRKPLTYVRNVDRVAVVKALADAGLPLAVCGPGWRDFLGERRNVSYIDQRIPFRDMPLLYNEAGVVINLNAGNGACERALHAAMAGAAVVSDHSNQLAAMFEGSDGLAWFSRANPENVAEIVGGLIESGRGEEMAERGRRRAMEAAPWINRAQQLVDFVEGRGAQATSL